MMPFSPITTASTSRGTGRDVNTASLPETQPAGVSDHRAPSSSRLMADSRRRSWTVSSCPALDHVGGHGVAHVANPDKPSFHRCSLLKRREVQPAASGRIITPGTPRDGSGRVRDRGTRGSAAVTLYGRW